MSNVRKNALIQGKLFFFKRVEYIEFLLIYFDEEILFTLFVYAHDMRVRMEIFTRMLSACVVGKFVNGSTFATVTMSIQCVPGNPAVRTT